MIDTMERIAQALERIADALEAGETEAAADDATDGQTLLDGTRI